MTFNLDEPGRQFNAVPQTESVERGCIGLAPLAAEIAAGGVETDGSEVGAIAPRLVDRDFTNKAMLHIR